MSNQWANFRNLKAKSGGGSAAGAQRDDRQSESEIHSAQAAKAFVNGYQSARPGCGQEDATAALASARAIQANPDIAPGDAYWAGYKAALGDEFTVNAAEAGKPGSKAGLSAWEQFRNRKAGT